MQKNKNFSSSVTIKQTQRTAGNERSQIFAREKDLDNLFKNNFPLLRYGMINTLFKLQTIFP